MIPEALELLDQTLRQEAVDAQRAAAEAFAPGVEPATAQYAEARRRAILWELVDTAVRRTPRSPT